VTWIALKARVDCPECGLPVLLEGPWAAMRCPSCHSETAIGYWWGKLVAAAQEQAPGGRRFAPRFAMDTSKPIPSIFYAVNKGQPPICSGCDKVLDAATQVATGTDGSFQCTHCGEAHETFPAPRHLQGGVAQVFLALREGEQLAATTAQKAKPVMFSCTNCGGNLKITAETTRIVTCQSICFCRKRSGTRCTPCASGGPSGFG
jgi:hypothetical protein